MNVYHIVYKNESVLGVVTEGTCQADIETEILSANAATEAIEEITRVIVKNRGLDGQTLITGIYKL